MVGGFRGVGVVAVVAMLTAASCGDLPPPEVGQPPSTSVAALDGVAGAGAESVGDSTATTAAEGAVPALIIASPTGISIGSASALIPFVAPLDELEPVFAVDDHLGGLVVQSEVAQVWWFPGEGGSSQLINVDGGSLLDVALRDDTPAAVLLVETPDGQSGEVTADTAQRDESMQRIDLVELVTGTRETLATLDPGRSVQDFATGGGVSVVLYADEACGGLLLLDAVGAVGDGPIPSPACPLPTRSAFGAVAIGPDGTTMVYTEVSYRPDGVEQKTVLVGRDVTTGTELFRVEVGGATDRLSSLAFDGQRVVLLRRSLDAGRESGPILFDLRDPEDPLLIGRPDALSVTFARGPVSSG